MAQVLFPRFHSLDLLAGNLFLSSTQNRIKPLWKNFFNRLDLHLVCLFLNAHWTIFFVGRCQFFLGSVLSLSAKYKLIVFHRFIYKSSKLLHPKH